MKIERETTRLTSANLDGMIIDGLSVADLLEYWRGGHAAKSA
jgi:hypothetical protein